MNIKAIAKEAGVSVSTVSRVINHPETVSPDKKERVLNIINKTNYTPNLAARMLVSGKSKIIGLIIPDILDPSIMETAKGIEDIAHEKGYGLMLCNGDYSIDKEKSYVNNFIKGNLAGLIIVSTSLSYSDLQNINIPYVLIGNEYLSKVNVVYTNIKESINEALEHLMSCNRKNIAMILQEKPVGESKDKLDGYISALKRNNLSFNPEFVISSNNNIEGGMVAASKLLEVKNPPDGIIASSDMLAFGAISKIKAAGLKVPDDIAIIGFNGLKFGNVTDPALTTVVKPCYKMGLVASHILFDLIEKGVTEESRENQEIILKSKLVIRKSCGNKARGKEIW